MTQNPTSHPIALSICIPTRNFGPFIEATLRSILGQERAGEIEVIVADGASTDNTSEIVRDLQKEYSNLSYLYIPKNGGIDRDMARAVEAARGEYCWTFSADDLMLEGSISLILDQILDCHDIYLCKHNECTYSMRRIGGYPVLRTNIISSFNFADRSSRQRYFELAANTEAFFGYLGGIIFKRATWSSVELDERFVGTCFAHAARLLSMSERVRVKFLPFALIDKRGGNDSFLTSGYVDRLNLSVKGYNYIADELFGHDSMEARQIRRSLWAELGLRSLIFAKYRCRYNKTLEDKDLLDDLAARLYSDGSFVSNVEHLIYRLFPVHKAIIVPVEAVYRRLTGRQVPNSLLEG